MHVRRASNLPRDVRKRARSSVHHCGSDFDIINMHTRGSANPVGKKHDRKWCIIDRRGGGFTLQCYKSLAKAKSVCARMR